MSALGPAGWFVREGAAALIAIAGNVVRGGLQRAGVERAGNSVRAIRATVDQRLQMHSSNRAVLIDTVFECHQDRMAAAVTIKNLHASQADFDGPVEHESGFGYNDFVIERIAFSAEAAAVGRGDYANMRSGHFQNDGDRSVLLDCEMGVPLEEKSVLENFICFGKTFFHVAEL